MPENADILDSIIAIAIILFILSVIVEKITQLIRRYSPFIKPGSRNRRNRMAGFWRHIKYRQTGNSPLDKKIEREVTSLSFVIGCLIALAFRVDLFKMMSSPDPRRVLFWGDADYTGSQPVLFFISIPLTGLFLSFGSKFFHDLIDTLLQVKNLKRKLADENTYKVETVDQLDDFLNKTYTDIIRLAIDQNRDVLQTADAVSPPMHGKMYLDGRWQDCIDIHLSGKERGRLPQSVQTRLSTGKQVTVPVHVIFDVEIPTVLVNQGDSTANENTADFKGTICCRLQRGGKDYLLTCSHVYTGGTSVNNYGNIDPAQARIGDHSDGYYTWAVCTDQFDLALLAPDSVNFVYRIDPGKPRKPVPSDNRHTKVRVVCRNNEEKEGVLINDCVFDPVRIQYRDKIHALSNLMIISAISPGEEDVSYSGVTIPGDSGACVYAGNQPIGMIVAGNNKFSYAIPLVDILGSLTAKIKT